MKLPVIRGKIGDWTYYSGVMTFEDIAKNVKTSIEEIYKNTCLNELFKNELTENYNNIKQYILYDKEHFLNAIILAIFDDNPQWLEVEFPEEEREYTNVGFLKLTGEETIFPINGQHQIKGIIKALTVAPTLAKEQVPIIFVAHKKTEDGRKRTRKLFLNLNNQNKTKSGTWLKDGYHKYHCSSCLFHLFDNLYYQDKYGENMNLKYKFCPNCGAKMGIKNETN